MNEYVNKKRLLDELDEYEQTDFTYLDETSNEVMQNIRRLINVLPCVACKETQYINRDKAIDLIQEEPEKAIEILQNMDSEEVVGRFYADDLKRRYAERNCFTCGMIRDEEDMSMPILLFHPEKIRDEVLEENDRYVKLSDMCKILQEYYEVSPDIWQKIRETPSLDLEYEIRKNGYIHINEALDAVDKRVEKLKHEPEFEKKGLPAIIDIMGVKNHLLAINNIN